MPPSRRTDRGKVVMIIITMKKLHLRCREGGNLLLLLSWSPRVLASKLVSGLIRYTQMHEEI